MTPMTKPPLTLAFPAPPDPVAVALDPAKTALLIFDIVDPICTRQPNCSTRMVPVIAALLQRARKAGVTIGYGTRAHTMARYSCRSNSPSTANAGSSPHGVPSLARHAR